MTLLFLLLCTSSLLLLVVLAPPSCLVVPLHDLTYPMISIMAPFFTMLWFRRLIVRFCAEGRLQTIRSSFNTIDGVVANIIFFARSGLSRSTMNFKEAIDARCPRQLLACVCCGVVCVATGDCLAFILCCGLFPAVCNSSRENLETCKTIHPSTIMPPFSVPRDSLGDIGLEFWYVLRTWFESITIRSIFLVWRNLNHAWWSKQLLSLFLSCKSK